MILGHRFEAGGSLFSLIGFDLNSIIEVASETALLWRLHHDLNDLAVNRLNGARCGRSAGASLR
jgi:hypothetical protein